MSRSLRSTRLLICIALLVWPGSCSPVASAA